MQAALPAPKVLAIFDAFTGMVVEMLGFPLHTDEPSKVCMLHRLLAAGDLLVGDRDFCSFVHLAMLRQREVTACFCCHERQIVDSGTRHDRAGKADRGGRRTWGFVRRLGKHDLIVHWNQPCVIRRRLGHYGLLTRPRPAFKRSEKRAEDA